MRREIANALGERLIGADIHSDRGRVHRRDRPKADHLGKVIDRLKKRTALRAKSPVRRARGARATHAGPARHALVMGQEGALSVDCNRLYLTLISRKDILLRMSPAAWSFLTNHARVLLCIAEDPTVRLREIGDRVGVTERAAHRIVNELVAAGYLSRQRTGRRNHYTVHRDLPLPDRLSRTQPLGELLAILAPATEQAP
ncbi:MAG TPA: helix-turn-helix domain-containing protein [Solirubrobacteraceae bacterium]|nr:helix-turn-helix domain-containing protein [Solirubrobacteraceae bacterium]